MPFTPFHLGPALLIGVVAASFLHLPTLLVASVAVDVEPLVVLLFNLDAPLHGPLHSFLGAAALGLAIAAAMYALEGTLTPLYEALAIPRHKSGFKGYLAAALIGTWSHVLLDAPLYAEMRPFFPLSGNPFLDPGLSFAVYGLCAMSFLLGSAGYIARVAGGKRFG